MIVNPLTGSKREFAIEMWKQLSSNGENRRRWLRYLRRLIFIPGYDKIPSNE